MSDIGIYRQAPEHVAPLDGLFHANQATKIPKAMLIARSNNIREPELNGDGTKTDVQAAENLHSKNAFEVK